MILILGGSGYVGSFIVEYLDHCKIPYKAPSRVELDYYNPFELFDFIDSRFDFVINAAGYTGKPNVAACEKEKYECYRANVVLPEIISTATKTAGVHWGHISSGCLYNGHEKVFDETDPPNFSFESNNSSWYSGTKAHGERVITENCYVWRIRMPISIREGSRNYLDKILNYQQQVVAENSITWIEEFIANLPIFWEYDIEPGVYNMVNTGSITAPEVLAIAESHSYVNSPKWMSVDEFNKFVDVPRSNCVISNEKSINAGVKWTDVSKAVDLCFANRSQPNEIIDYRSLGLHWEQLSALLGG
jgi:UDP-glucose 4,6-dehydratase